MSNNKTKDELGLELIQAIKRLKYEEAIELIDKGANVNIKSKDGRFICSCIRSLIDSGKDVNQEELYKNERSY